MRGRGPYEDRSPFQQRPGGRLIERALPVSKELPGYRPGTARRDVIAGVTVAALAIPSAMAYAELAGLSPVVGLYALLLPTIAYGLLGSSRQVIVGPEGSLAALVAAAVLSLAASGSPHANELGAMLALLVAACFLLARVLRLAWIADYLSRPVLIGYIHGVAVVLIVGQLGKLLGLDIKELDPIPQLVEVGREIGDANGATVAVGLGALAVLLPLRYVAPRLPAALVVLVASIVAAKALDLDQHGVALVGAIPSGLPSLRVPSPGADEAIQLIPAAAGIFLVSFADEVLTARSYAGRHGQHVDVSQELVAMSASNAAAAVTQGMPVGASGSRTAVNDGMGARSQVAGLVGALAVAVVLLLLTAPIESLPKAVLGAAIVAAAIGLVDLPAWRDLWSVDHVEVAIAAVTTIGVVVTGVLEAIGFAVGLSIVDVVRRSARPHDAVLGWVEKLGRFGDVAVHRDAKVTPGVVVYRLDDRLFFANASYVKGRVREALAGAPSKPHFLVLDGEALTHVDAAGLQALGDIADSLEREGVHLVLARAKTPLMARLEEAGLTDRVRVYPTVREAVESCAPAEPLSPV